MTHFSGILSVAVRRGVRVAFALIPLGCALLAQLRYLVLSGHAYQKVMLLPLVLVFFLALAYGVWRGEEDRIKSAWLESLLVMAFCIALRLAANLILSTNPESDFRDAHLFALDILNGSGRSAITAYTFMPYTPYLNNTALFFAAFYWLFGADLKVAKLLMVALSALTALMIYLAARELTGKPRVGIVAALIYSAWPSVIAYTGVISPEHIAAALWISLYYGFLRQARRGSRIPRWLVHALTGALIGVLNWYRPIGMVVVCSFLGLAVLEFLSQPLMRQRLKALACFAALYAAFSLVSAAGIWFPEKLFAVDLPSTNQLTGYTLLVGMNYDTWGTLSWDDEGIAKAIYARGVGYPDANRQMMGLALERVRAHWKDLPRLLAVKFTRVWESNQNLFFWASFGSNDQELIGALEELDMGYTLLVMLLLAPYVMLARTDGSAESQSAMLVELFVLGFALLLLITEAQMRYRVVLMPYLALLAALGLHELTALRQPAARASDSGG